MGFLTTVTIYNDRASELIPNAKKIAEQLTSACYGEKNINTNLILQKPRHADNHTLYMHADNTVIDVYDAKSDWALSQFISEMEYHLKRLKQIKNGI